MKITNRIKTLLFALILISIFVIYYNGFKKDLIIIDPSVEDISLLSKTENTTQNKLLSRVFIEISNFKKNNLDYLNYLNTKLTSLKAPIDYKVLQLKILQDLDYEESFFKDLNYEMDNKTRSQKKLIPPPLHYNMMIWNIDGAKKLIRNHFQDLLNGNLLLELKKSLEQHEYLVISSDQSPWLITSEATFLKAALIKIISELDPKFKSELFDRSNHQLDFLQFFEMDKNLYPKLVENYSEKSLLFVDFSSMNQIELALVHNGYSFGGNRNSEVNKHNECFDCTSWLAYLLGSDSHFNTLDLLFLHRYTFNYGFVDNKWLDNVVYNEVNTLFEPTKITSIEELKPGMIFASRKFKIKDMMLSRNDEKHGISGHAGVILSVNIANNRFLVASYSRYMPLIEGLHIRNYSFKEEFATQYLYFNVK